MAESAHSYRWPAIPRRSRDGHKGAYGRVLIVAGSRGMSGAAALAGVAALRSGAGLVTVAGVGDVVRAVAAFEPSLLTLPLAEDDRGRIRPSAWDALKGRQVDAAAIGPGLGQGPALRLFLERFLEGISAPVVVDADALNLLVGRLDLLARRSAPTVFTPHPGEFSRLTGLSIAQVQADRVRLAAEFAVRHRVILVLKGPGTVVADGSTVYVNDTGNPGMGTGGTGDVLTGMIAARIGQKDLSLFDEVCTAVNAHGMAGDLVADRKGEIGLIASDLLETAPAAFQRLQSPGPSQP